MPDSVSLFVDQEELRLTSDGRWLSNGEEILHAETVRAFFRHLERVDRSESPTGWQIRIGPESKSVIVEDVGVFVTRAEGSAEAGFLLNLSNGKELSLDPSSLRYQSPGRLYCRIGFRPHAGDEEAAFLRQPAIDLLFHAEETADAYLLRIGSRTVTLYKKF